MENNKGGKENEKEIGGWKCEWEIKKRKGTSKLKRKSQMKNNVLNQIKNNWVLCMN